MTVPSMLGRFLEISLHTPDIQASLEFYESLGFEQASVSETWPYPYASSRTAGFSSGCTAHTSAHRR